MKDYATRRVKHKPAQRRALGRRILEEQREYVDRVEQKILFDYQGFQVALPARMKTDEPGVWLIGRERYPVKTKNDEIGCLIRMDNRLDSLADLARDCAEEGVQLVRRMLELERELQTPDPYIRALADVEKRLRVLDRQLKREGKA
jgi:hypothetical protein